MRPKKLVAKFRDSVITDHNSMIHIFNYAARLRLLVIVAIFLLRNCAKPVHKQYINESEIYFVS